MDLKQEHAFVVIGPIVTSKSLYIVTASSSYALAINRSISI